MCKLEKVWIVVVLPGNLTDAHAEVFGSEDEAQKHATESGVTTVVRWVNKDLAKRVMYWKRDAYVYGWLLTLLVHGNLKEAGYQGSRYEHLPRDWSGYNSERNAYSKNE